MEKKLKKFLDDAFAPYGDFPSKTDVTKELLANLQEKYEDLKTQGKSDEEAYQATIDSFGDVSEIMEQLPHSDNKSKEKSSLGKTLKDAFKTMNSYSKFSHTTLKGSDLTDIDLHQSDFNGSEIRDTHFDRSDLIDSAFRGSDSRNTSFAGTNLTNVVFTGSDVSKSCFDGANLTGAKFKGAALAGSTFTGATLVNVDFSHSDLGGVSFDDQELVNVNFNSSSLRKTSFKNTTFHNPIFHFTEVKHTIFDGAKMDKVTYALLKGAGATLIDITII